MTDPAQGMVDYLETAGLSLTEGTNMFKGIDRAVSDYIPINCLFVRAGGGPAPDRVMGLSKEEREAIVHLRLRWNRYEEGNTKIIAIMDALQGIFLSGYQDVMPMQSHPNHIPLDEERHVMFLISYSMRYEAVR